MKRVSLVIMIVQLVLILFAKLTTYYYQRAVSVKWDLIAGFLMKYQTVFMLIIIASFFAEIFSKEKLLVKLTVIALTVITFIIWDNLWLYPW